MRSIGAANRRERSSTPIAFEGPLDARDTGGGFFSSTTNGRSWSYDLVLPFYKMAADGTPTELVGTCFPIGIGIYLTAAHNFAGFEEARRTIQTAVGRKDGPNSGGDGQRLQWMKEDHFLEGEDVNCGALVLDQVAIRRGKLKALGFSLVTSVIMTLDFDLAVLFVRNDQRRNPRRQQKPDCLLQPYRNAGDRARKSRLPGSPGANGQS